MSLVELKKRMAKQYHQLHKIKTMIDCTVEIFDISSVVDNDSILKNIEKFRKKYPLSMSDYAKNLTNVRSWTSDYGTHRMTDIFDDLLRLQEEKIKRTFEVPVDVQTKESWINIYKKGDSAIRHNHGIVGWSTIYFAYAERSATPVVFDDNTAARRKIVIEPKTGMLLLFPSLLFHSVPAVNEQKRITVATNVQINSLLEVMNYPQGENNDQ